MKYLLSFLILCSIFAPSLKAQKQTGEMAVAQVFADKQAVILGDSCLLTYVVQSSFPILKVTSDDELEDQKHTSFRRLPTERQMRRTLSPHGITYTLVWSRYVMTPAREGDVKIPRCGFEVQLLNPRKNGKEKTTQVKIKSNELLLSVKPKPVPTTRELLQRGEQVL